MDDPAPDLPVGRAVVLGIVAVAILAALAWLVRPLIFTLAPERSDANAVVAAVAVADDGPLIVPLLLNEPHGLPGEEPRDDHVAIRVAVSPAIAGGYAVVAAWSPVNDCPITLGADRLLDCAGAAWTYEGDPIRSGDPPLRRFAVEVREGVLIVDFTRPAE